MIKDHKAKMKKIQEEKAKLPGPRASYMGRIQAKANMTTAPADKDLAAKLKKRAEEAENKDKEDQKLREEKEKEKEKEKALPVSTDVKESKDSDGYPIPWPKGGIACEICKAKIWGRDTAAMGDNHVIIHAKCKGADPTQNKKAEDIAAKLRERAASVEVAEQTSSFVFVGKGMASEIWQLMGAFDLHWIGLEPVIDETAKTRTVQMPIDENVTMDVQEKEVERNDEEFWYTYVYPKPPFGLEFLKKTGLARMALVQEGENVKFEWRVTFTGTKSQANELNQTLASAEPAVLDAYRAASEEGEVPSQQETLQEAPQQEDSS